MKAIEVGHKLLVGICQQGNVLEEFTTRQPTGRLRRILSNVPDGNPYKQTLAALELTVVKLGPVDHPRADMLGKLSMPDIDFVNFMMTAARHPQGIPVKTTCGYKQPDGTFEEGCGQKISAAVDPRAVEIVEGTAPVQFEADGQQRPFQVMVFHDPELGREVEVVMRLPLLQDQISLTAALKTQGDALGDVASKQFSNHMLNYDKRGRGLTVAELDDLPLATFDALFDASRKVKARQLDMEVVLVCPSCGKQHTVLLPTEEWLAPFEAPAPSQS